MTFTKEQITQWVKDASGTIVFGFLIFANFQSHQAQITTNTNDVKQIKDTRYRQSDAAKDIQIVLEKMVNLDLKIQNLSEDVGELKEKKD